MLLFPKAKVRNLSDRSSGSLQLSKSSHPREADSDSFYLTVLTEYTAAGTALDLLFFKSLPNSLYQIQVSVNKLFYFNFDSLVQTEGP